jgi:hypothetical protein
MFYRRRLLPLFSVLRLLLALEVALADSLVLLPRLKARKLKVRMAVTTLLPRKNVLLNSSQLCS